MALFLSLALGAFTIGTRSARPDDVILGHLSVDFACTDRPTLPVYLRMIVRRTGEAWSISHYQVSPVP
jgi:hypothetical protein